MDYWNFKSTPGIISTPSLFKSLLYNTIQYNKDSRLPTVRTRAHSITLGSILDPAYNDRGPTRTTTVSWRE